MATTAPAHQTTETVIASRRWQRMFPGFRLRMTRWGGVYLGLCLVVGMAAVNSGNNSLIAVLGTALGAYVVSGAWSRQVLGSVDVRFTPPREIFAGKPALGELRIDNRGRVFPAYGLVIRDQAGRALSAVGCVPAGRSVRRTVSLEFDERGRQSIGGWRVDVLLPLGFFLKSKRVVDPVVVTVYPRLVAGPLPPPQDDRRTGHSGFFVDHGREGDVVQLRGFREGDELRHVHWKQTARQQRLIVVDRQREAEQALILRVDPPERRGGRGSERFERRVSEAATTVVRRLEQGDSVGLVMGGRVIGPERQRRHAGRLLEPLATVGLGTGGADAP
jgi:uncharacterized protein (DUF58 family)